MTCGVLGAKMLVMADRNLAENAGSPAQKWRRFCYQWRSERRLSQEEMGKMLGVSRGAVGNFETGRTYLSGEAMERLMKLKGDEGGVRQVGASRECPSCGELVPSEYNGRPLLFCGNCGEALGVECPNCEHLNTDPKAMYCTACGEPLTEEAYKAREGLAKISESKKEKAKRKAEERRQREAERRKRGEPEL